MESHATISNDVLCRYVADAARQVPGVRDVVGRRGVRVADEDGRAKVELRLAVEWGAFIPHLGREVQQRVREYLARMADIDATDVDVVVDEIVPNR